MGVREAGFDLVGEGVCGWSGEAVFGPGEAFGVGAFSGFRAGEPPGVGGELGHFGIGEN